METLPRRWSKALKKPLENLRGGLYSGGAARFPEATPLYIYRYTFISQ